MGLCRVKEGRKVRYPYVSTEEEGEACRGDSSDSRDHVNIIHPGQTALYGQIATLDPSHLPDLRPKQYPPPSTCNVYIGQNLRGHLGLTPILYSLYFI